VAAELGEHGSQSGDARVERVAVLVRPRWIVADHLGQPRPVVVPDLAQDPSPAGLPQLAIPRSTRHAITITTIIAE
jgi:hypothetical protein